MDCSAVLGASLIKKRNIDSLNVSASDLGLVLMAGCAVIIFLLPLIWGRPFYVDWINDVWFVEYFKEDLEINYRMPIFFNTFSTAANPAPIFYGFLLYPILSVLALASGADNSIRLMASGLVIIQLFVYQRLLCQAFTRPIAFVFAAVCVASIYQMTNIYNRSALNEFFSYEMIAIATPLLIESFLDSMRSKILFMVSIGFLISGFGAHPPTAFANCLFVIPVLIAIFIYAVMKGRMRVSAAHILSSFAAFIVIIGWVALVARYSSMLKISHNEGDVKGFYYFPTTIDAISSHIGIANVDVRVLMDGMRNTSTPFLDAPLQIPLFFFSVAFLFMTWRQIDLYGRLVVSFIVIMITAIIIILNFRLFPVVDTHYIFQKAVPTGTSFLSDILEKMQYAYRLVNILSIQILCLVAFLANINIRERYSSNEPKRVLITLLLSMSLFSIAEKYQTTSIEYSGTRSDYDSSYNSSDAGINSSVLNLSRRDYNAQIANMDRYPPTFAGETDYAMQSLFPGASSESIMKQVRAINFMSARQSQIISVDCSDECVIQTNLLPTALVDIFVNGKKIARDQLFMKDSRLSITAMQGRNNVEFKPRGITIIFCSYARYIGVLWFYASIIYLFWLFISSIGSIWLRSKSI